MIANIDLIIRGISMSGEIPHIVDIRDAPFNAVPSADTGTPVDASAAINAAIEAYTLNRQDAYTAAAPTILIPPADGYWYLANPIRVTRSCRIMGAGGSNMYGASRLRPGIGVNAIEIIADHRDGRETAGGHGTIISNLSIRPRYPNSVTRDDAYGIYSNTQVHLHHLHVKDFGNDNICIDASSGGSLGLDKTPHGNADGTMHGNAVGWTALDVRSDDSRRNGFRVVGDNAHGGCGIIINTSGNNGCGVIDQTYYGNNFISPHFGGNGFLVENGVHNIITSSGTVEWPRIFICYRIHTSSAANEPGVGADWEDYWYEFNTYTNSSGYTTQEVTPASLTDPLRAGEWQSGEVYVPTGMYGFYHDTAGGCMWGVYAEAQRQGPLRVGANSTLLGGTLPVAPFHSRGSANTSFISMQGALTYLNVENYDASGNRAYFGSDPGAGDFLKWGNQADSSDGTPVVYSLKRDAAGSVKGYEVVHQDNTAQDLIRFEKDGSSAPEATIQRLEDRIFDLENP